MHDYDKKEDINKRIDPLGSEFYDISDQILALSNELSEEIVLGNIQEQMSKELDPLRNYMNYVSLYRRKYTEITTELLSYDKEYIRNSLETLAGLVSDKMEERFGIKLGKEVDFYDPAAYLKDAETLYEFLFIRQFQNLTDYFFNRILEKRRFFLEKYSPQLETPENENDKFVINAKRLFVDQDDVVIMHFLGEIIEDVITLESDALELFKYIINLDPEEEFNFRMSELLELYGSSIIFDGVSATYRTYMEPLQDIGIFTEVRNNIWVRLMRKVEVNE